MSQSDIPQPIIDAVAMALARENHGRWADTHSSAKGVFRRQARLAIEALRKADAEALRAAFDAEAS